MFIHFRGPQDFINGGGLLIRGGDYIYIYRERERARERDVCIYIYIYIHMCVYIHMRVCIYIYIYMCRERERERENEREKMREGELGERVAEIRRQATSPACLRHGRLLWAWKGSQGTRRKVHRMSGLGVGRTRLVRGEFLGKLESSNLSERSLSREIGRRPSEPAVILYYNIL